MEGPMKVLFKNVPPATNGYQQASIIARLQSVNLFAASPLECQPILAALKIAS
jgi:hypothetical protein